MDEADQRLEEILTRQKQQLLKVKALEADAERELRRLTRLKLDMERSIRQIEGLQLFRYETRVLEKRVREMKRGNEELREKLNDPSY